MTKKYVHILDTENLLCPLPVLKARKALKALSTGELLTVTATDPMADIDIPHMCQEDGHDVLSHSRDGTVITFVIRRGDHKIVE